MSALSEELSLAQSARQELMKWKLIVVSALGAAGLGFVENKINFNLHLVILLIPFSCVYIDLLCRNLSIKTKRIAFFLSTLKDNSDNDTDIKFAKFYLSLKTKSGLSLETYALVGSSITISLIIAIAGFIIEEGHLAWLFLLSGLLSIFISFLIELRYNRKKVIW